MQVDSLRIELSGKGRKGLEVFRVAEVISTCVRKLKLDLKLRFPKKPRGLAEILAQHISEPGAPPAARSSEVPAWKKLTAEREFSLFSKAGPATPYPSLSPGVSSNSCPLGFPGGASGKEPACQRRRHKRYGFSPWVGKIPLEKGIATHSSILSWRLPWTEEHGGLQSIDLRRVRHDIATQDA